MRSPACPLVPPCKGAALGSGLGSWLSRSRQPVHLVSGSPVAWRGAEPGLRVQWFQHFAAIRPQGATGVALTPPRRRLWGHVRQRVTPLRGDSSPALSSHTASCLAPRSPQAPRCPGVLSRAKKPLDLWTCNSCPSFLVWVLALSGRTTGSWLPRPTLHARGRAVVGPSLRLCQRGPLGAPEPPPGSVCSSLCDKGPPRGQVTQQIYLLTSWRLQAQGQGARRACSPRGPSAGHTDVVFSLDPHVVIPLYVWVLISSSDKDTSPVGSGSHPLRPHLPWLPP